MQPSLLTSLQKAVCHVVRQQTATYVAYCEQVVTDQICKKALDVKLLIASILLMRYVALSKQQHAHIAWFNHCQLLQ